MSLSALLTEYEASAPKRAAGGLYALSGFDFQLRVYLADFAAALVDGVTLEAVGHSFANALEALSDHTRLDQDNLVCVQSKFTINVETLGKAALEFTLIDRFLEASENCEEGSSFRYEVVGRALATTQPLAWAHVQLPAKAETADPSLKCRFEHLRDKGALLPPRLDPDPWWRLICIVYPHISDPFGFARRALDRCLNRGRRSADASAVRDAIAEDFLLSRRERRLPGSLLKMSDFTTSETSSREIVIGQSPTLKHLRDGRFMERPERVSEALLSLRRVVDTHAATLDEGVDVFWINGRSGCGKSVLLLQIAAALMVEEAARILWLGNSAAQLPELFRYWSESQSAQSDIDYLFVDDLYDPQARDDLDLSLMVSHILHTDSVQWPVIVTCGPPEFRSVFERDSRAEGFRVHTWELSPLWPAETQQFRVWFERRTGTAPHTGPASIQREALMISVMAEMQHGDLRPFAHRFRARLVDSKLDLALRVPLALNRLYIWSPRAWLTSDEESRLAAFNLKGDISLLSVESRAGAYLKLTHPHLSTAIYDTLRPNSDLRGRAEDLVSAFQQALDNDLPTAFRVLRSVATDHARLHDVDEVTLATSMATVWLDRLVTNLALYGSEGAEAWVYWCRWAARDKRVGDLLGSQAPLDKAIISLGIAHRFWARLWLILWQCAPGHHELVEIAFNWLPRNHDQHSWISVWDTLVEYKLQTNVLVTRVESETSTQALAEMGLRWLAVNTESLGWPWVWQRLTLIQRRLPNVLSRTELVSSGTNWLDTHRKWSSWSYVWGELLSLLADSLARPARCGLLEMGWNWLPENENNSGWPFVWQRLMDTNEPNFYLSKAELRQLGEQWSERHPDSVRSAFITLALLEDELTSDVDGLGYVNDELIVWCENNVAIPGWQWLWHRLNSKLGGWLSSGQHAHLVACAHRWLESNEGHDRFGFVWEKVFREEVRQGHTSEISGLLEKGLSFIADIADDTVRDWLTTWFTLRNHLTSDGAVLRPDYAHRLADPAIRWLKTPGRNNVVELWRQICLPVLEMGCRDIELLKLAADNIANGTHLAKHANPVGFASLLCECFNSQDLPENLVEWICQWLVAQSEDRGGLSSWHRLHRATETALTRGSFAGWQRIRRALEEFPPIGMQHWDRLVAAFQSRQPVRGRIIKSVRAGMHKKKGGGFIVDIGINAFLPYDEFDYRRIRSPTEVIGNIYDFEISRLNMDKFQIDLSRLRLLQQELNSTLASLTPGTPVRGTVKAIRKYGAFVDLGFSDALLYASETDTGRITDLSLGQELSAKVLRIDLAKFRIWLTTKEST